MSHIELDDQILNHPKFIRAIDAGGADVWLLWCGLRAYCSQLLTDGFVPVDMFLEVRGPRDPKKRKAALQVLKDKNLVEDAPGGVVLHDYLDWADSREEILMWKQKARDRKRKERCGSRMESHEPSRCDSDGTSRVKSAHVTPVVTDTSPARMGEGGVTREDSQDLPRTADGSPPVQNSAANCERSFDAPRSAARDLFDAWQRESEKTGVKFSDWAIRQVFEGAAHDGVTAEQVTQIVNGAKHDEWAVQKARLMPSPLLKNPESRAKFLDMYRNPPTDKCQSVAPRGPQYKSLQQVARESEAARQQRDRPRPIASRSPVLPATIAASLSNTEPPEIKAPKTEAERLAEREAARNKARLDLAQLALEETSNV
jgi:hypothetical protein